MSGSTSSINDRGGARPISEDTIPGASLSGRDPSTLNMQALKRWLECRKAPTKGRKADLVERVNSYIRNGWDKHIIDPDKPRENEPSGTPLPLGPTGGWKSLVTAYAEKQHLDFTNAQILSYFVTRTAEDGLPVSDFKSVNSSASNLFRCGHVQMIEVYHEAESHTTYFRADCLPEMKKDRVYKVEMKMDRSEIVGGRCGCPAGRGPTASCKHIAALCYALEQFERVRKLPEYVTSTEKLQSWNQPRLRKLKPVPIETLSHRKNDLSEVNRIVKRTVRTASTFDPRPTSLRESNPERTEQLRCSLLSLNRACGFLHVLVPDVQKISHDHQYCANNPSSAKTVPPTFGTMTNLVADNYGPRTLSPDVIHSYKQKIQLSRSFRERIEVLTRQQASSVEWHSIRSQKITASICGRIVTQRKKSIPLLRRYLYTKPLPSPLPDAIVWGKEKEKLACVKYVQHMHERGHSSLEVHPCGFFVHSHNAWLGASPDALVMEYDGKVQGLAEFKCPYSKRDRTPLQACDDRDFYCQLRNGSFHLKEEHEYYHQVQLQLYVCKEKTFCDFCVYTPLGCQVERILPSKQWQDKYIPELEEYFDKYMLPEILDPPVQTKLF